MKYSVGVLIYHRTPELVAMAKNTIASIRNSEHGKDLELIIVDNGSTKGDSKYWQEQADVYVRFSDNRGISAGWNTILKLARGSYIAVLNDDIIVHSNWLDELEKCFREPNCGVANVHMEHLPHGKGIVEDYKWYSGSCFMLNRNTIDKVGYFDEEIWPCNTEDWDYWIRVYKAGLKLYKNFNISIQHLEGQTVHAQDLSAHTQALLKRLEEKVGFNPTDVFCGNESIYKALS